MYTAMINSKTNVLNSGNESYTEIDVLFFGYCALSSDNS